MKSFRSRFLLLALSALAAFALAGCADTKMTSSSVAPGAGPIHFTKLFILALARDDFNRRLAEVALKEDVTAIPTVGGYEMLPDINDLKNKGKVLQAIKDSGADGLIVLSLVSRDEKVVTNARHGAAMDYMVFSDYYTTVYDAGAYFSSDPRSVGLDTIFVIETRIFDAKTGKVIWTGETKSTKNQITDHDVRALMFEVAGAIRAELQSANLIR